MPLPHVDAHNASWNAFRRAETHDSHKTIPMIAGNDRGPIRTWCCPIRKCGNYAYSYSAPHETPLCGGGFKWSFSTTSRFDSEEVG